MSSAAYTLNTFASNQVTVINASSANITGALTVGGAATITGYTTLNNFLQVNSAAYFGSNVGIGQGADAMLTINSVNQNFNTANFYGNGAFDANNVINIQNNASQYGRNIIYMTGRWEGANDGWSATNPRNGIVFRNQANLNGGATNRFTIQNNGNSLGFLSSAANGGNDTIPALIIANNRIVTVGNTFNVSGTSSFYSSVYVRNANSIFITGGGGVFTNGGQIDCGTLTPVTINAGAGGITSNASISVNNGNNFLCNGGGGLNTNGGAVNCGSVSASTIAASSTLTVTGSSALNGGLNIQGGTNIVGGANITGMVNLLSIGGAGGGGLSVDNAFITTYGIQVNGLGGLYVANSASIQTANITTADTITLSAHVANITTLNVLALNGGNIAANDCDLDNVTALSLNIMNPTTGIANIFTANITNANLYNANIINMSYENIENVTTSNISVANIITANITTANITTANIISANITGLTVNANITAATASIGSIGVTGVNAANVTASSTLASNGTLNVSGVSTLAGVNASNVTSGTLNVTGVSTLGDVSANNVTVANIYNVSTVTLQNGIVIQSSTAELYNGSSSALTNGSILLTNNTTAGVGYLFIVTAGVLRQI